MESAKTILPICVAWLFVLCAAATFAQTGDCEQTLLQAERSYTRGAFDEAIELISACLEKPGLTVETQRAAFRLLALTYIAQVEQTEAEAATRNLLAIDPTYQPDPELDPPPFASMVESLKKELPEPLPARGKRRNLLLWAGAGFAAVAAVFAFIFPGNEKGSEKPPIGEPPPLPTD